MILYTFLIFLILNSSLFLFCKKYSFLSDQKVDVHKKFIKSKNSYLLGGLIILIYFSYFYLIENNYLYLLFFFSFFMIGLLSDIKILNDPKKRFFLQLVVLIFFIFILNIKIIDTRNDFFNKLLINDYINKFFVIFCLMVLINGSNFVDGLNTLILTYYLCVFLIIFLFFKNIFFDIYLIKNLIIVLISIILFNIFGFIFLGDSGAYLISLFSGISLIHFAGYNTSVSPYFIILLFWYPCFELLFSMIRRSFFKKKLYNPDNMHLHQFLYLFLIKKLKLKNFSAQLLVSLMINFFNIIIFFLGTNFYNQSFMLIFIITFNIAIYSISYYVLIKKLNL